MNKDKNTSKYENALKHLTELKEFYQHLLVYVIFIILWLGFKENIVEYIIAKTHNSESEFLTWLRININLVPIIWGIGILIQWVYLNKLKFSLFKKWEDKKIKEFMSEEDKSLRNTQKGEIK